MDLGLAIADINNDGWDDIYVGNDFHENDYYYVNNGKRHIYRRAVPSIFSITAVSVWEMMWQIIIMMGNWIL